LLQLLRRAAAGGYQFTTPAPNTSRRVRLRHHGRLARDLQGVFGWNLPFKRSLLDPELFEAGCAGGAFRRRGELFFATVRIASVGSKLFLHSAIPARGSDPVFFGPDSYRFVDFLRCEAPDLSPGAAILDIGTGTGVGGIVAAGLAPWARLSLADVNEEALRLARINAAFSHLSPDLLRCDGVPADSGPYDLVIANPPYIAGSGITYSDGGNGLGGDVTLAWARSALATLAPGGHLLLYSGSAIVDGHDAMRQALTEAAVCGGFSFRYREIDPDVFPATLLHPRYWRVERIAAVGAVIARLNA
jgi:hypothetical protein